VEVWFHEWLQVSFDDHLGDAVGDRGYPQRPGSTIVLRYVHPSHRRRKVAAGRQSIPQLVEGYSRDQPRSPQSTARLRQPHLGWLLLSCMLPILRVSECQTALLYPRDSSRRRLSPGQS